VKQGYTDTINVLSSTTKFTVYNDINIHSGCFKFNNVRAEIFGGLNIDSGTTFIAPQNNMIVVSGYLYNQGNYYHNGDTFEVYNPCTIRGLVNFKNVVLFGCSLTMDTNAVSIIEGDLINLYNGSNYINGPGEIRLNGNLFNDNQRANGNGGTGTIRFTGTGNQTLRGNHILNSGTLPTLLIDKPSGTLFFKDTIGGIKNPIRLLKGTIDASTYQSTIGFSGPFTLKENIPFHHVQLTMAYTTPAANAILSIDSGVVMNVKGDFIINGQNTINGLGEIQLEGNLHNNNPYINVGGTSTIRFSGTGDQIFKGNHFIYGGLPRILIDKPSGKLFLKDTIGGISKLRLLRGEVDASTYQSTVSFSNSITLTENIPFHHVHTYISNGALNIDSGVTLNVKGNLTIGSSNLGGVQSINGSGEIKLEGNLYQNNTIQYTGNGGNASIRFMGTGDQILRGNHNLTAGPLPPLVVDKPSGTLFLKDTIGGIKNSIRLVRGTFDASTYKSTVCFVSDFNLKENIPFHNVIANMANYSLAIDSNVSMSIKGDFTDNGIANFNGPGEIKLEGNLYNNIPFTSYSGGGNGIIRLMGSGEQIIRGNHSLTGGTLPQLLIDKPFGTLYFKDTLGGVRNPIRLLKGTVDASTYQSTVSFFQTSSTIKENIPLHHVNLALYNASLNIDSGATLKVNGNLTLGATGGTQTINGLGCIELAGNAINKSNIGGGGTGKIIVNGTGNQTIAGSNLGEGVGKFPSIIIQKPSGTVQLPYKIYTSGDFIVKKGFGSFADSATLFSYTANAKLGNKTDSGFVSLPSVILKANAQLGGNLELKNQADISTYNLSLHNYNLKINNTDSATALKYTTGVLLTDSSLDGSFSQKCLVGKDYRVPFRKYNNSTLTPVTFKLDTATLTDSTYFTVATYGTDSTALTNRPLPQLLTSLTDSNGNDASKFVLDRFWKCRVENTTDFKCASLKVSYLPTEFAAPNTISSQADLKPYGYKNYQAFNTLSVSGTPSNTGTKIVLTKPFFDGMVLSTVPLIKSIRRNTRSTGDEISNTNYIDLNFFDSRGFDVSKPVGSIDGAASVSATGAVTYTMPIATPPATNGMAPNLSINYNSQGGNGLLGWGWNLGGLSSIARTGKDYFHDQEVSPIVLRSLDPNNPAQGEQFSLDGQKLIKQAGSITSGSATFVKEVEDYSIITSNGVFSPPSACSSDFPYYSSPDYFEVKTKEGLTLEYGNTALAKNMVGNCSVRNWLLNKTKDNNSNYVEYHYSERSGEKLIDEILFTGNEVEGMLPYSKVKFEYETRFDQNVNYLAGTGIQSHALLKSITLTADQDLAFKKYSFDYGKDELHSYLIKVTETGTDGTSLNSTVFKYGKNTSDALTTTNTVATSVGHLPELIGDSKRCNEEFLTGDFNGDGFSDVIGIGYYLRDLGAGGYTPSGWSTVSIVNQITTTPTLAQSTMVKVGAKQLNLKNPTTNDFEAKAITSYSPLVFGNDSRDFTVGDFLGKGRDGLLEFSINSSTGTINSINYGQFLDDGSCINSSFPVPDGSFLISPSSYYLKGDFDGDGRQDYVLYGNYQTRILISYPGKNLFNVPVTIPNINGFVLFSPVLGSEKIASVEFDGDGASDILGICNIENYPFTSNLKFKVWSIILGNNNTATLHFKGLVEASDGYPFESYDNFRFGDFNGDNKTDVLAHIKPSYQDPYQLTFGLANPRFSQFGYVSAKNTGWDVLYSQGINSGTPDFYPLPSSFLDTKSKTTFTVQNLIPDIDLTDKVQDIFIADINNDGQDDVLETQIPTYSANISISNNSKDDLSVLQYSPSVPSSSKVYYSSGMYFLSKALSVSLPHPLAYGYSCLGDYNGDGKKDILLLDKTATIDFVNGTPFPPSSYADKIVSFNPNSQEHLLQKVADGFNNVTSFQYKSLTDATVHARGSGAVYPLSYRQSAIKVASIMESPDAAGGIAYKDFFYTNATTHVADLGFLGFGIMKQKDYTAQTTSYNYRQFSAPHYVPLTEYESTELNSSTSTIVQHWNMYSITDLPLGRYKVQKTGSATSDLITQIIKQESIGYDNFGNVVYTHHQIPGVEEAETVNEYAQYGGTVPNRLTSNEVLKTRTGQALVDNKTTYGYNNKGLLVTKNTFQQTPQGNSPANCSVATTYSYDNFGNMIYTSSSTPNNAIRGGTSIYDTKGRFPKTTTNSLAQQTIYDYDLRWTTPKYVKAIDNQESTVTFDGFGRVSTTITPRLYTIQNSLQYNGNGGEFYALTTQPASPEVKAVYTSLGLPKISTQQGRVSTGEVKYNLTSHNDKGLVNGEYFYSTLSGSTMLNQYTTYNDLNQPTEIENSTTGITTLTYSYPGNGQVKVTATEPDGRTTVKTTDAAGKLIKSEDPGGVLTYTYDSYDNLIEVKNNGTIVWQAVYNEFNQLTQVIEPNTGTVSYQFDGFGQLTQTTDALQQVTTLHYDQLGRVTERIAAEGTTSYAYTTANNGKNQIQSITDFNGNTENFTYNAFGDLTNHTQTINGVTFPHNYEYDAYGYNSKETYPAGFAINNTYDNGYLTQIKDNQNVVLYNNIQRDLLDQPISWNTANGKTTTLGYAAAFLPKSRITTGVQNYSVDYAGASGIIPSPNITKRTEGANYEDFSYDKDRLTTVSLNGSSTPVNYSYEANGNIAASDFVGNYTYTPGKPNAVRRVANTQNLIDPAQTQTITYTPFHKASKLVENNYELNYTYGADYERTHYELKHNGSLVRTRDYAGNFEVNDEQTGNPQKLNYVAGPDGSIIAIVEQDNSGTHYHYTYTDHLGSIVAATDENGTIETQQSFDAWGRYRNPIDWSYTNIPATPNWLYRGFTGHEMLPEFGLVNMNGRMYDPLLGRMLSPDNQVQEPDNTQSYNRYTYALNNPLRYTDPTGWEFCFQNWNGFQAGAWDNPSNSTVISLSGGGGGGNIGGGTKCGNQNELKWKLEELGKDIKGFFKRIELGASAEGLSIGNPGGVGGGGGNGGAGSVYYMGSGGRQENAGSNWGGSQDGNTAKDFVVGAKDGFVAGGKETWHFAKSLTSTQGWKNMGNGYITLCAIASPIPNYTQVQFSVSTQHFVNTLPDRNAYEWGYGIGYGGEKVVEFIITKKATAFAIDATRIGFGGATFESSILGKSSFLFGRSKFGSFGGKANGIFNRYWYRLGWSWDKATKTHNFQFRIGPKFGAVHYRPLLKYKP
jgi:RHS repeat-associated protein